MTIVNMMRKIMFFLSLMVMGKKVEGRVSIFKIKAARAYVLGIKKIRTFHIGALLWLFAFIMFVSGLLLLHIALFAYSGWTVEMKFSAALLLGVVELIAAVGVLTYLFSEKTWAHFSEIHHVVNYAIKNKSNQGENANK
ncbi:MAG: hypothetical protein HQL26_06620 [Candidatus Omnitrophica bacterium]|nr:hypothetical protein [Candidatus Omnitrophota bacterium]